jgi:hypothetical protein
MKLRGIYYPFLNLTPKHVFKIKLLRVSIQLQIID